MTTAAIYIRSYGVPLRTLHCKRCKSAVYIGHPCPVYADFSPVSRHLKKIVGDVERTALATEFGGGLSFPE